ncbi:MAG: NAD-dependent epimerase/dehydratase family protein [Burkholderiales bacterium]
MKRLLLVGVGDIAHRLMSQLPVRTEVRRLSRRSGRDLDRPETLAGIGGWADTVLHCAPPPGAGEGDPRTANLLVTLERGILPGRIVYVSTSGVYGDCGGALVDETRAPNPQSPRAKRRADAERCLQQWCTRRGVTLVVLRAPGIYAVDQLPLERLRACTSTLRDEDDIYTNHIHADDLAAAALRALAEDASAGVYNTSDDTHMKMGKWLDLVADCANLLRPPRVARSGAESRIPPALLSFMGESRRLDNRRLKETLGVRLRYATVYDGLRGAKVAA